MYGKVTIQKIKIRNILSFGGNVVDVDLQPLNVIIGPNGSGKSNFVEIISLLSVLPISVNGVFINGGGFNEWKWKGLQQTTLSLLEVTIDSHLERLSDFIPCRHEMVFTIQSKNIFLNVESIVPVDPTDYVPYFYRQSPGQRPLIYALENGWHEKELSSVDFKQSILAQRSDPDIYPALNDLSRLYKSVLVFAHFPVGRFAPVRLPQDSALDSSFLFEDASNLALVLNDLQNQPQAFRTIIDRLKQFYPRVENIITRIQGGTVQVFFQEEGLTQTVPATRLSDGTLRYLCLLVILCHPTPPPLICIEEPELGMHPDIIPIIAELLIEASQRTQLIVTTHSSMLVSAIGETDPEAVVVCERDDDGTQMRRLDKEQLAPWLERYSLGDLWMKGEIGGTRW